MYIYQTVWRNLLILAHNLLIYAVVAIGYGLWPTWQTLLVIPGVVLICINSLSFGLLLGTLSARFRDIPPIVGDRDADDVSADADLVAPRADSRTRVDLFVQSLL